MLSSRASLILIAVSLVACHDGQDPGSGGSSTTATSSATSSDAASSSSGGPLSCDHLAVDPVVQRPVGHSLVRFTAWPGAADEVVLFALESPAPEEPGTLLPGDVWATRVYEPFGATWPPLTLHERRITTDNETGGYLLDDPNGTPSIIANGTVVRDVLGASDVIPVAPLAGHSDFVALGGRFVVGTWQDDLLRMESFGDADVVEEPPVACSPTGEPFSMVRLPRAGAGSLAVVTLAPNADDPTCANGPHTLAIDRYDLPADPSAPMIHTPVARVSIEKELFKVVATESPAGAWVLFRLDTGEHFALPLDADGQPVGAPIETPPLSPYTVAIASRGDDLALFTASDADGLTHSDASFFVLHRDGTLGPSATFPVSGTWVWDTSVYADPQGRGFLVSYWPVWEAQPGYARIRCE